MSATTRRTARSLTVLVAVPVALAVSALPASARPDAGPALAQQATVVLPGWPEGSGPAYPGQRYGIGLSPEQRGHLLEFMDR